MEKFNMGINIDKFIALSRKYGQDEDWVQAGGGNTSIKMPGNRIWIKASGVKLKEIQSINDFVQVDMIKVKNILNIEQKDSLDQAQLDLWIKDQLNESKIDDTSQRPSIETFLHALIPFTYVVHLHPVFVNALTCMKGGKNILNSVLPDQQNIWVEYQNPGYALAKIVQRSLSFLGRQSSRMKLIFLENHGVIVSADSLQEIDDILDDINQKLRSFFQGLPLSNQILQRDEQAKIDWLEKIQVFYQNNQGLSFHAIWSNCGYCTRLASDDRLRAYMVQGALYPDHVVFCGESFLTISKKENNFEKQFNDFVRSYGSLPKIVVIKEIGVMILGYNQTSVQVCEEMLRTHIKVFLLLQKRGEPKLISSEDASYLSSWEWEKYRNRQASKEKSKT